ncbi:Uma2 family endonuclease [Sphingomonas sp. 37zxx]|uniref:Uma2 family endonuclease n=1 Tax=Sphingomonas sp. 37zxx TaxID=1550073 RepID=UPI00053BF542|nr:Uma2 family endonuclease [Sphingomonas sp. 37zxx]
MTEYRPLNTTPEAVRLRIEDYLVLDQTGAFEGYAKTELIAGEIWFANAQHRPHALTKMRLYDAVRDALSVLGSTLCPIVEASIAFPPSDAPEPDIIVTSEPLGEGLIPGTSVHLVIEVADTTLQTDLGSKADLYARNAVPEYWVADINRRVIHQLSRSADGSYSDRHEIAFGDAIESIAIPGLRISSSAL